MPDWPYGLNSRGLAEHGRRWLDEREFQVLRHRRRQRLAVPFLQFRLGIEQIHLARPAFHEQEDDALRLGREMRLPGGQRVRRPGSLQQSANAIMPSPPPAFSERSACGDTRKFNRIHALFPHDEFVEVHQHTAGRDPCGCFGEFGVVS